MARKKVKAVPDRTKENAAKDYVLETLGTPPSLLKVDVFRLNDDSHFRVNVYVITRGEAKIKHSFYVTSTPNGYTSNPKIKKSYHTDEEIDALVAA